MTHFKEPNLTSVLQSSVASCPYLSDFGKVARARLSGGNEGHNNSSAKEKAPAQIDLAEALSHYLTNRSQVHEHYDLTKTSQSSSHHMMSSNLSSLFATP